jgi:hypothetical protein
VATQAENRYIDLVEPTGVKQVHSREITLYIVSIVALITTLIVLAVVVRDTPDSNFDTRFSREIRGWESPVAKLLFESVSEVASLVGSIVIGLITVALLAIGGRHRLAFGVFFAGMFIGAVSLIADYSLGQFVGRDRPISGSQSFPSGHVFGTIAFYGFAIYLALRYRLRRRLLIPPLDRKLCSILGDRPSSTASWGALAIGHCGWLSVGVRGVPGTHTIPSMV